MIPLYWPNIIGYVRILFLIAAVSTFHKHAWTAAGYYTISEILDALDGHVARWLNQASLLGACLDQVTDRLSTLAIYMLLCSRYPSWSGLIFALAAADIGGHWIFVHAQTLRGARTHKEVHLPWPFLRFYYSNRLFMFTAHLAYEVLCCSFLVCSWHKVGTFPYESARWLGVISAPLGVVKAVRLPTTQPSVVIPPSSITSCPSGTLPFSLNCPAIAPATAPAIAPATAPSVAPAITPVLLPPLLPYCSLSLLTGFHI
ncbi:putative CDP-diacylglycerol-inositol 3-phosphatidyltransferase [Gregarina niphandrodes]|uniref:CDP-diacylglycerol-inositol 3-phosphatidyltransferase n=1 Tax=Gregarina niphandrodes TaxID=110365 RepID=A0A023AZA0_GRENI|nr:putative CDP-diacylglycerol-inositol 3-phosphatidyltransferase [Gregarina niphandrodes]EZG43645.1 putative CDP-diacylglycerol-inositol 3-phosphatidyltransferase [Gregarina niphandrodes]|eukprot:XP_011133119.1 putative CDP-diacylglycerol-inositol 3-phosphatidyltransferase [Gregarina niphandrodes]